jgi:ABC-type phosphate/phosphonate transport system substrate-binding protein
MRYEKVIFRIRSGEMSRADLTGLRDNAIQKLAAGDVDAQAVISYAAGEVILLE